MSDSMSGIENVTWSPAAAGETFTHALIYDSNPAPRPIIGRPLRWLGGHIGSVGDWIYDLGTPRQKPALVDLNTGGLAGDEMTVAVNDGVFISHSTTDGDDGNGITEATT